MGMCTQTLTPLHTSLHSPTNPQNPQYSPQLNPPTLSPSRATTGEIHPFRELGLYAGRHQPHL